ncbi:MAG: metallophosphoesterase family protein, partial [Acutalibacteraceae bacterium]
HDYETGYMPGYGFDENNQKVPVPQLKREKLLDYYGEFGYNDAVSVHEESMSYVAQLADGYRLLALNDDYGDPHCGFSDDCLKWIREQAKRAHEDGQVIFAMTHHPLIAPSVLYQIIGGDNVLYQREMLIEQFSDMGMSFIFTGHSHVQNISSVKTKSGKTFYDISTAALIGYPPVYRKVEILPDEKKLDIRTVFIDQVKGIPTNGLTLTDYTKKLFFGSISDAIENAVNDYEKFAEFAIGMSISKEVSYKYQFPIKKVAAFLNRLTFGKLWKLVRFSSGVSPAQINMVYHKKVVPFMIDVAANLYKGDADIEKSSVEYRVTRALLEKLDKLSKPFSKKLGKIGIESISSVIMPLIHNDGLPDSDAVLYY